MAIRIRRETVSLLKGKEKFTILQISDVHIWWSARIPDMLEKIIEETKPDLVALTGDYSDTPRGAAVFSRFMEKTGQVYPVVFIGGNHDIWWGKKAYRPIANVSSCTNVDEHFFSINTPSGHRINIGTTRHRSLFEAHKGELNLLLIHNPEELKPHDTEHVQLVLAGHLHGGQIVLFKKKESLYPGGFVFKHCSDRKQIGNTTLIVSRGAGDTFPIRYNCPKEVVLVTIS